MLNLHSPREITAFLNANGIHPSKALGQNFLIDRNMLDCIIAAADILPGRKVLEIGTGLGVLTEALLAAGAEATTVEKDVRLHAYLRERFEGRPRCNLVFGDALALDYAALFAEGSHTHLISNLPYSVGTRVVVEASAAPHPPQHMTLLLQKEVCERFCAKENSPDRGALSVWLQQRYDAAFLFLAASGCRFLRGNASPPSPARNAVSGIAFLSGTCEGRLSASPQAIGFRHARCRKIQPSGRKNPRSPSFGRSRSGCSCRSPRA